MKTVKNNSGVRNRTIRWSRELDVLAIKLANERGCDEGGVSELLSRLVQEEFDKPRLPFSEPTPAYLEYAKRLADEKNKNKK